MDKSYKYDSEIADLVYKIMGNGTLRVETVNESILVYLYELRGTPLKTEYNKRDNKKDYYEVFLSPTNPSDNLEEE